MMARMGFMLQRATVLFCASVAVVAVGRPPTSAHNSIGQTNVYDWSTVLQLGMLAAAAVALAVSAQPWVRRAAAVVGASAGAQLAGTGIVAHRRWITSAGFGAAANNHRELQAAVTLAVAGFVAVAACTLELWRDGGIDRHPRWATVAIALAIAAIVALWVPFAMGYEPSNRRTQVGAHALMYSLPWAGVLALGGLVDRALAAVAVSVVVISAVPVASNVLMIPAPHATAAASLATVAAAVLLVSRWMAPRRSVTTDMVVRG
jgi:hypothetical protein